jgi:predicted Zn-dependent peptidase
MICFKKEQKLPSFLRAFNFKTVTFLHNKNEKIQTNSAHGVFSLKINDLGFYDMNKLILSLLTLFVCINTHANDAKMVAGDPLKVQEYTLKNGLKVFISVNKRTPKIQTYIATKVGSKNDPAATTGLSHYLEHLLFKGSEKIGTINYQAEKVYLDQIENKFEEYRATSDKKKKKKIYQEIDQLSQQAAKFVAANEYDKLLSFIGATGTNAFTAKEKTVYVNNIPSNRLNTWIDIEFERFRAPVFRLFHTELETVYEEKNRAMDNDNQLLFTTLLQGLFPTHPYGTQTTLGSIAHLKKPSILNVKKHYQRYYVPNNMAIILAGDLDPEKAINKIKATFGTIPRQEVPLFKAPKEQPIKLPIIKEVTGPEQAKVYLGYRMQGANSNDADLLMMTDMILANGKAGLIDLDINQSQKVLGAFSSPMIMKDYSLLLLGGMPTKGQSLEEVKTILLQQIEKLKKGEFADWLPKAVVNDLKLNQIRSYASNQARVQQICNSFALDMPWEVKVNQINRLALITKKDIIEFANRVFKDNYVVVYKRQAPKKPTEKIKKPQITPIQINPDNHSNFYEKITKTKTPDLKPQEIDFKQAIKTISYQNGNKILYKKNLENDLFELQLKIKMGSNQNSRLQLAFEYLDFLATSELSNFQIKEKFYQIGCEFSTTVNQDETILKISGLSEYMSEAVDLVHAILKTHQLDPKTLDLLKKRISKSRQGALKDKNTILQNAMLNWIKYGPKNPFKNQLTPEQLKKLTAKELSQTIAEALKLEATISYFGPQELKQIQETAESFLNFTPTPMKSKTSYPELPLRNQAFIYNFPGMEQVQMIIIAKAEPFNKNNAAIRKIFNKYFGLGMSSIVSQQIRESQALAYTAYSYYSTPDQPEQSHYSISYIGTQADKFNQAFSSIMKLLHQIPLDSARLDRTRTATIRELQASRIQDNQLIDYIAYLNKMGITSDPRPKQLEEIPKIKITDLKEFASKHISKADFSVLLLGDISKLDLTELKKSYKIIRLKREDLFPY